jgi:hypothetical protein
VLAGWCRAGVVGFGMSGNDLQTKPEAFVGATV